MAVNEISQNDIIVLLDGYRKRGLSEEMLELVENDLKNGLTKSQVDIYAAKKVSIVCARAVSEAQHLGATSKLAHRLIGMDEYRLGIVMEEFRGGLSEEKILKVLSMEAPAHGIQELFDHVKEDMASAGDDKEEKGLHKDGDVVTTNQADAALPGAPAALTYTPEDIAKAMEPMITRIMDGRLNTEIDRLERRVSELQSDLASSAGVIKNKEGEISRLREEMEKMKERQVNKETTVEVQAARKPDNPGGDISTEAYVNAVVGKMKAQTQNSMMSDKTPQQVNINGNYQTYLTTADGRKIPVQIEHTQTRKPKGMLAMMSKLFTGTPSQKALLNMLIDSRLKPAQLAEIKRAKDNHFTDEELKDLIECDLPAEEMAGIINVIISDR